MSKNLAYDKNSPIQLELGLIGWGAGFSSMPVQDSLLSFKYSMLSETQGDENQFTFNIELINPVEEFENLIQDVYSRMFASIKGATPSDSNYLNTGINGYPKLLIRWGYGPKLEDGRSQVHVANISNIHYKFTSNKEKVLTIEAKDMLGVTRQLIGSSYIRRSLPLFDALKGPDVSAGPELEFRSTGELVFSLIEEMLKAVPGSQVKAVLENGDKSHIETMIQQYAMLSMADTTVIPGVAGKQAGSENLARYTDTYNSQWSEAMKHKYRVGVSQLNFLRKIGLQCVDYNTNEDWYLIKYALKGGSAGIVTLVVPAGALGDNSKSFSQAANETNDALYNNGLNAPLYELQTAEGIAVTKLIIGTDITDFKGGDRGLGGVQAKVSSSISELLMISNRNEGTAYSVRVMLDDGSGSRVQWLVTPTGAAKLDPIVLDGQHSSTAIINDSATAPDLTELFLKQGFIEEGQELEAASVAKFDPDDPSQLASLTKDQKEMAFGSRNISLEGNVMVSIESPAGETAFETAERILGAFNKYIANKFNAYSIYTIPPQHLKQRDLSMKMVAEQLLGRKQYEITFLVANYIDAIYSELMGVDTKGDPESMRFYSFDDVNMLDKKSIIEGGQAGYASEWAYLNYGYPNSIVKFFDFTGEFWYLQNYYRGVAAASQAKSSFGALTSERLVTAIGNLGEALGDFVPAEGGSYPYGGPTKEETWMSRLWENLDRGTRDNPGPGPTMLNKFREANASPEGIPIEGLRFSRSELKQLAEVVIWAQKNFGATKVGTFLTKADVAVIEILFNHYNRSGPGEKLPSIFSTIESPIHSNKANLIELGIGPETINKYLRGDPGDLGYASTEPFYYVLQRTEFQAHTNESTEYIAKTNLLATRLLNSIYSTQIRLKTLGLPEMDTVNEIYKRNVFFVVKDVSRERFVDMNLNTRIAKGKPKMHWLSGQYRPIGIVHTITPSDGYITELKMYRDPRAVESVIDALESGIES